MRHLLGTLFVTTESAYLTLDGENVVVKNEGEELGRLPLHTLESIVSFTYAGASPALMGACAERHVALSFLTPTGRFLARSCGRSQGNVLLRRIQYRGADQVEIACLVARNFIFGKVYNGRWVIERTLRDHALRVDEAGLRSASQKLHDALPAIANAETPGELLGLEGAAAAVYFGVFDELILNRKDAFFFHGRSRRPPLDNVNALLSFTYTLLASDCAAALEAVGLDSYVGFFHRDRPGRSSLALDLMEELRPCLAERFVLSLINTKALASADFIRRENGAVVLTDSARRTLLKA
ncbi:MAG: CRISPR-associated endonuclease Cas1, partial [Clostridia bacterium]